MDVQKQTQWYQEITKHKYVYIFGAGLAAIETLNYIANCTDKKINGFIVSDITQNPREVMGYPVFELSDEGLHLDALVIMSTSVNNNNTIKGIIKQAGFTDVIPSAVQMEISTVEKFYLRKGKCGGGGQTKDLYCNLASQSA